MNKTERLKALQAEYAAKFQVIVDEPEAPEPAGSLLPENSQFKLTLDFNTIAYAGYREAISTLIELRRQPGTEKPKEDVAQWSFYPRTNDGVIHIEYLHTLSWKIKQICPCFATEEQARAAKEKIGTDRLKQMFNTLHGVE
jgi:hypothetical protein